MIQSSGYPPNYYPQRGPYRGYPQRYPYHMNEFQANHPVSTAWLIHQSTGNEEGSSSHSEEDHQSSEDTALQNACGYMDDMLFSSFPPENVHHSQMYGRHPAVANTGAWPQPQPSLIHSAQLQHQSFFAYPNLAMNHGHNGPMHMGQQLGSRSNLPTHVPHVSSSSATTTVPVASQMNLEGFGSWPYVSSSFEVQNTQFPSSRSCTSDNTQSTKLNNSASIHHPSNSGQTQSQGLPSFPNAFDHTAMQPPLIPETSSGHMSAQSAQLPVNIYQSQSIMMNAVNATAVTTALSTEHSPMSPVIPEGTNSNPSVHMDVHNNNINHENNVNDGNSRSSAVTTLGYDDSKLTSANQPKRPRPTTGVDGGDYNNLLTFVHESLR